MALVRFYTAKNNTLLLIGAGFLGTTFLDGYHAVVTSSFFAENFPSGLPSLIPWSWVASRWFLSVLLFLSWLAWRLEQRDPQRWALSETKVYFSVAALTLVRLINDILDMEKIAAGKMNFETAPMKYAIW